MTTREFWAAEAAKMRDTSAVLGKSVLDAVDDSRINFLKLLKESISQFEAKFGEARKKTEINGKEVGFIIYIGSDGKLYLSNFIEGTSTMIDTWVDELDKPTAILPIATTKTPEVTLTLAGIYHSHPDKGKDGDPFSDGDIKTLFDTLKKGAYWREWVISAGFFVIADDTNGGRYAAVVENLSGAKGKLKAMKDSYDKKFGFMVGAGSGAVSGSIGEKIRKFYGAIFTKTNGVGIYYTSSYNSNLLRL